jgi:hypothetical protein
VCPGELAPDHAEEAALLLCAGLVDVGDALAEVELCLALADNSIHLDQGGVVVLVSLAALVTQHLALHI